MARTKSKAKLRVVSEFPPPLHEQMGVPESCRGDLAETYARVIGERQSRASAIRRLPVHELVPADVRREYATRWRDEDETRVREEALTAAYHWRAIFRRLIDRIVGAVKLPARPDPKFPFQG